jgi:N-acetylated-alpha-linked acidic dipeptidase
MHIEQSLLRNDGLPRRPWFRHQIYAPGFYTGYGVKTVPGVREAIEQKQWSDANAQIEIVAKVIEGYVSEVEKGTAAAKGK